MLIEELIDAFKKTHLDMNENGIKYLWHKVPNK